MVYNLKMLVYALFNKQNRVYVGMTQNLSKRLLDHNLGRVFSTKGFRPWKVLYHGECGSRINCRVKERYLKSGTGKEFLKSKLPL